MARPGTGHFLFGLVLFAAGVGVTLFSGVVYWYGALIVGVIEMIRGVVTMLRAGKG